MNTYLPLFTVFAACLGAAVGSFLNVVILRLPENNLSIAYPASRCPDCHHPLSWYENIPVISFLLLCGRCHHCKTTIALQYPVVELLMAALTAALFLVYGMSLPFIGYVIFTGALLVASCIDLHHMKIPDSVTLPGIITGVGFSLLNPYVHWQDSLIGALAGGGVLLLISILYSRFRGQAGIGGGDVKLLGMIGAFLGYQSLVPVLFISSVAGIFAALIIGKGRQTRIVFGPFLSTGGLCTLFISNYITL